VTPVVAGLLEPLGYDFMIRAIGVSAVVGVVCAVLSCYITLKGWSLMGDAVSHSVLPGVVLAYIAGLPFALGAFVFGLGSVVAIGFVKARSRIKEDTAIGVVFTGLFALGIVLISKTPSSVDLTHILFGNALGISDYDTLQTLVIGVGALAVIAVLRKDLLLFCFDVTHARSIGLNTTALYYTFLALLAAIVVAALQAVGIILVVAMLITPGATAYLLTDRFNRMVAIAVATSLASSVLGAYASYYLDGSTGGCIVVLQTLLFAVALVTGPKHGLLAQRRRGRRRAGEEPRAARLEASAEIAR
jgi:manganese transport system permease protein